jgi:hypothetical protein
MEENSALVAKFRESLAKLPRTKGGTERFRC